MPLPKYSKSSSNTILAFSSASVAVVLSFSIILSACHHSGHFATVSWQASASPAKGYYVYRSTRPGGPYQRIHFAGSDETSYIDSEVTAGATYYYVVTAVSISGKESAYSPEVAASVPGGKR